MCMIQIGVIQVLANEALVYFSVNLCIYQKLYLHVKQSEFLLVQLAYLIIKVINKQIVCIVVILGNYKIQCTKSAKMEEIFPLYSD